MTELMKRYEAETGKDRPTVNIYSLIDWYEAFSAWLADQLCWRLVSEPPKEGQIVFAMIPTGWVAAQYLNGEFYIDDGFTYGDLVEGVIRWLPIPPAPEGEVK